MWTELLQDPLMLAFVRFMAGSTLLLGGVWIVERLGWLQDVSLRESAWKAAVVGAVVLMIPLPLAGQVELALLPASGPEPEWASGESARAKPPVYENFNPGSDSESRSELRQADPAGEWKAAEESAPSPAPLFQERAHEEVRSGGEAGAGPLAWVGDRASHWVAGVSPVAAVWVVYGICGFGLLLASYGSAIRELGGRHRVSLETREGRLLTRLVERTSVRFVPYLSRSDRLKAPVCLMGREICLPGWAFDRLDDTKLESLLAHELAHLERRDPWMLLGLQLATRLFFFQPLLRIARQRLMDLAELQADAWAADRMKSGRSVAEALFECAQNINDSKTLQWGFAMTGRPKILSERVGRLLDHRGEARTPWARLVPVTITMLMLGTALAVPTVNFAEAAYAPRPADPEAMLDPLPPRQVRPSVKVQVPHAGSPEASPEPNAQPSPNASPQALAVPTPPNAAAQMRFSADGKSFTLTAGNQKATMTLDGETVLELQEALDGLEEVKALEALEAMAETGEGIARATEEVQRARTALGAEKSEFVAGDTFHRLVDKKGRRGNYSMSDDKQSLDFSWAGDVGLSDDLKSLAVVGKRGRYNIVTNEDGVERELDVRQSKARMRRDYEVNGEEHAWDADAEAWLEEVTERLVTRAGFGARQIVETLVARGGADAAVDHIEKIETDYIRRVYVEYLAAATTLEGRDLKRVIRILGALDSDYEKRLGLSALIAFADLDGKAMDALLVAAAEIDSDYELRLLATELLKRGSLSNTHLKQIAKLTREIDSNYELRLFVTSMIEHFDLTDEVLDIVIRSATRIDSNYEYRLLASTIFDQEALTDAQARAMMVGAREMIDSNYEMRLLVAALADMHSDKENAMLEAVAAVGDLDSSHEARLAVAALARALEKDSKAWKQLEKVADEISSSSERRRALASLGRRDTDD